MGGSEGSVLNLNFNSLMTAGWKNQQNSDHDEFQFFNVMSHKLIQV